jgi:hemolysin III
MPQSTSRRNRPQTRGEELANALSHGFGFVASVAALPVLVVLAVRRHDPLHVAAVSVYGATLALLFLASTVYHAVPHGTRAKQLWRLIDHGAIYLLIAGTYTPFALGALRGPWGWSLLAAVWTLALLGVAFKAGFGFRHPRVSTGLYLLMGWLAIVAVRPLLAAIGLAGFGWLLAGGLAYTLGVVFYVLDHRRYMHFAWHLFVIGGSACHFFAVVGYAAGP